MKTTEQLITEGAEYFKKTGKHLFTTYNPNGTTYYHVSLMEKDGVQYRVRLDFSTNSDTVNVYAYPMDKHVTTKAEYSQLYFRPYHQAKAVRQNKYLKKILVDIKNRVQENLSPDKYRYEFKKDFELEKSGV